MKMKKRYITLVTLILTFSVVIGVTSDISVSANDGNVKVYETKVGTTQERGVQDSKQELEDETEKVNTVSEQEIHPEIENSEDIEIDSVLEKNLPEAEEERVVEETIVPTKEKTFELKSNETTVDSYDELKVLISNKGYGVYDTFYLTADIEANSGVTMPAGYHFTIDGTNPYTGERHSYIQTVAVGAARTESIYSTTSTATSITMQNMDIYGTSKLGIVNSSLAGTTQKFDNVNYYGPMLAVNGTGKTTIKDSEITNTNLTSGTYLFRGKKLELEGNTTLNAVGAKSLHALDMSTGALTIKSDADVTINHSNRILSVNRFEIEPQAKLTLNTTYLENTTLMDSISTKEFIMNDAKFIVNGDEKANGSAVVSSDTMEIKNSNIDINVDKQSDILRSKYSMAIANTKINVVANQVNYGILNLTEAGADMMLNNVDLNFKIGMMSGTAIESKSNIYIEDSIIKSDSETFRSYVIGSQNQLNIFNSEIDVTAQGVHTSLLKATNSINIEQSVLDFDITGQSPSGKKQELLTSKNINVVNTDVDMYINDPDIKYIFDVSNTLLFIEDENVGHEFNVNSEYTISLSKNIAATIRLHTQQINTATTKKQNDYDWHFHKTGYEPGVMEFKVDSSGKLEFFRNDFTDKDLPDTTLNLNFNDQRRISMGSLPLEYLQPVTQEEIRLQTNPNADILVRYNKDQEVSTVSDALGNAKIVFDPIAKAGIHTLTVNSKNLLRIESLDYSQFGSVELTEYPAALNFENLVVPKRATVFDSNNKSNLTVVDTRENKTGWKLEMRVKTPLHALTNKQNRFDDALIYHNPLTHQRDVITSKPLLIYETNGNYDEETIIEFDEMEGILLEFQGANGIYANTNYGADIEWILTQY